MSANHNVENILARPGGRRGVWVNKYRFRNLCQKPRNQKGHCNNGQPLEQGRDVEVKQMKPGTDVPETKSYLARCQSRPKE